MKHISKKLQTPLTKLIIDFMDNINDLENLLKLPSKYDRQVKVASNELGKFLLPVFINRAQKDLENPPKKVKKDQIERVLNKAVSMYSKLEPSNVGNDGKLLIEVNDEYLKNLPTDIISKKQEKLKCAMSYKDHLERAVLFNLICYLESSFSEVLHIILKEHPLILPQINKKQLSFEDLNRFSNIEDAIDHLISKEVENMIHNSLSYFLDFFPDKIYKSQLPSLQNFREELIEIKERRNIFVHNRGIVNNKYLSVVDITLQKKYKAQKGKELKLSEKYLENCIKIIKLAGLEIISFAAIKFQKEQDREIAIWVVQNLIYDTFAKKNKDYLTGESLSKLILNQCTKYLTSEQTDYFLLNYWYLMKEQKKLENLKKEIARYDVSSKNHIIQLHYFALTDNYEEACKQLLPSLKDDKFDLECYETFPILKTLRKQKKSKEIIKEYKINLES